MNLGKYAKTIAAAIGVVITVGSDILAQHYLTGSAEHWVTVIVKAAGALGTILGVYGVKNVPAQPVTGQQPAGMDLLAFAGSLYGTPDRSQARVSDVIPANGLGRRVRHDPRSKNYAVPETTTVKAVKWTRRVPVFDQGQVGSCTGEAATGWLGTDDATRQGFTKLPDGTPVNQALAVNIYSAAEVIDGDGPYPPNDNGSSGLSVAQVLKSRGLCSSYQHAFSINAAYNALQQGPVLAGTTWYNSMFTPGSDGRIPVDAKSGVAGGHEYVLDQLEVDGSGNVTRIWMQNSWGSGWGSNGRAWFAPTDFAALLADQGDITVPIAVDAPQPPQPVGDAFANAVAAYPGLAEKLAKNAPAHKLNGQPSSDVQYAVWLVAGALKLR